MLMVEMQHLDYLVSVEEVDFVLRLTPAELNELSLGISLDYLLQVPPVVGSVVEEHVLSQLVTRERKCKYKICEIIFFPPDFGWERKK